MVITGDWLLRNRNNNGPRARQPLYAHQSRGCCTFVEVATIRMSGNSFCDTPQGEPKYYCNTGLHPFEWLNMKAKGNSYFHLPLFPGFSWGPQEQGSRGKTTYIRHKNIPMSCVLCPSVRLVPPLSYFKY